MTLISKYYLDEGVYREIFGMFLETLTGLNSNATTLGFVKEFFSPTEQIIFSKRLAIGILVAEGYTYEEIKQTLKVSSATVSDISSLYKYGKNYREIIKNLLLNKKIKEILIGLSEKFAEFNSFGGKGSQTWREIKKGLASKKSKILR